MCYNHSVAASAQAGEVSSSGLYNTHPRILQLPMASYKQALRIAESEYWQAAIDTKYKSLQERQTWSLVVKHVGRKIVDIKWVFKVKRIDI
jgi:hypothetical protein